MLGYMAHLNSKMVIIWDTTNRILYNVEIRLGGSIIASISAR